MANKPQMTPEQQTKFKQAVAQGQMQPLPYDQYCAITTEEAEKMLKKLAKKVDFNTPLPDKLPPAIKEPDAPATEKQLKAINEAITDGVIESPDKKTMEKLTKGEASKLISEIHAKRPPELATESQMTEIDRLVKEGRIYGMKSEVYHSLSKSEASRRIAIGRENEGKKFTVEGYDPNYVSKRNLPKTPEQEAEIRRLVADQRLNPVAREKWATLTQEEAGKIIFIGQKREESGELAPKLEREVAKAEKETKAPEKDKKAKGQSRHDDMSM